MTAENEKAMAVIFSHGTTLANWESGGLLDREVSYYHGLIDHMGSVAIVTYDHPSQELKKLTQKVAPVDVLSNRWRINYRLFGLLAPFIHYKALKRRSLIRTNQLSGSWTGLIAKWMLGKPLVVRCGYLWSRNAIRQGVSGFRLRAILAVEGFVARRADMVLVATQDDEDYLLKTHRISERKLFVLPNPIDTDRFSPGEESRKQPGLIAYVGRLSREKNLPILISAVLKVPSANLMLIGSGEEEVMLKDLAFGCDRVEFKGAVPNSEVPRLLNEAEVFALPSKYEGSPKALLEAMACGLPVIGTDAPGIREVIRHEENGLLCQPNEEDLARAISRLLSDEGMRRALGRNARLAVVERHSQKGVIEREVALIGRLLNGAVY